MSMSEKQLEEMMERAAEAGAKKALHLVGLDDDNAVHDIKSLRSWIKATNLMKSTALKSSVAIITKLILLSIVLGFMYLAGVNINIKG